VDGPHERRLAGLPVPFYLAEKDMLGRMGNTLQKWRERLPSGAGTLPQEADSDKKLAEVKAVLERLHRISTEPEDMPASNGDASRVGRGALGLTVATEAAKPEAPAFQPERGVLSSRSAGLIGAALTVLVVAGAGGLAFWKMNTGQPGQDNAFNLTLGKDRQTAALPAPTPSVLAPADDAKRIAEAEKLITGGKVADARKLLDDLAPQSADAALMLARTYDPNFLRTISGADAEPDAAEAERWYRTWHANASKNGLSMEPERLDRIIRAMR
jgi:hypothetical protein